MEIRHFKQKEFIDFLAENGWIEVSNKYFNEYDRLILKNEKGETFPLQLKSAYYPPQVCLICDGLGIKAPKEFVKVFKQMLKMRKGAN